MAPLLAFLEGALSPFHMLVLLILGMLFFGKRLPEMGRYLGKSIVEFKKGLKGIEDELETGTPTYRSDASAPVLEPPRPPQRVAPPTPQFENNPNSNPAPPPV